MTGRVWIGLTNIERAWRAGEFGYLPDALAAGSGTAETNEDLARCEASQSGHEVATPNPGPSHIPLMNKEER